MSSGKPCFGAYPTLLFAAIYKSDSRGYPFIEKLKTGYCLPIENVVII